MSLIDSAGARDDAASRGRSDRMAGNDGRARGWLPGCEPAHVCPNVGHSADTSLDSGARSTVDTGVMDDCCCTEPASTSPSAGCGECGTPGRPVESVTVKAMLTTPA